MAKHFTESLCVATLVVGSVVSCADQPAAPQDAASPGGQPSSAGSPGVAGSLSPIAMGSGGVAGSVASAGTGGSSGSGGGSGGGGAGTAGASGSTSAGGMPPYVPPVSKVMCPTPHVGGMAVGIADFEKGLDVAGVDGRGGIWFGYSDGTGKQTDNPIPVAASDAGGKAMHVSGSGFTNWGSGIGCAIAFDFQKNVQCPYDASAFSGVRLKVKGSGSVRLRVAQVATTPATAADRKGSCDPLKTVCDGHHEVTIALTSAWTEHVYEWSDFKQVFGALVDFDPKSIIGLNLEFNSHTTYEAWVDDIAFTQAGEGGSGGAGAGGESSGGAQGQ